MLNDLRLGIRLLGRSPVLALTAIASLALGIGANAAIFTVLNGVLLQPLPYAHPDGLVVVWETRPGGGLRRTSPATFLDWREQARGLGGLAAFDRVAVNLTGVREPELLRGAGASGSFFETLGTQAAAGRTIVATDDEAGAVPVAVLTDGLWRRLFAGQPDVIGRTLRLNDVPHTIVGILPRDFAMPLLDDVEIWMTGDRGSPRSIPFAGDPRTIRDSRFLSVLGRLQPGVSRAQAQAEMEAIAARLATAHPTTNRESGAAVTSLHEQIVGQVRPMLVVLQLAVGLMLMIACANVASLLLEHGAQRERELALRRALGGTRARLVRQLLAETLAIAVPGGVLGLLVASWGVDALLASAPSAIPRLDEVRIDGTVLLFTTIVTLGTALLFGLAPALGSTDGHALGSAMGHTARVAGHRGVHRWHRALTIGELALTQTVLVAAGLLLASFHAAQQVDLGYATGGRIAAEFWLRPERYLQPRPDAGSSDGAIDLEPKRRLAEGLLERMTRVPGVHSAAISFTPPLAGGPNRGIGIQGDESLPATLTGSASFQVVSPTFFTTLGIGVSAGRLFDDRDSGAGLPVAIVNREFVRRFLPGRDPLGQVVRLGPVARHAIVGVVHDVRYTAVESPAEAAVYVPVAQNDERWPMLALSVWSDLDLATVAPLIRRAIHELDPEQPVGRIRTYDEALAASLAPRRFNTVLVALFAGAALLLAALGIYGVLGYAVAARAKEMAVRAALGAEPRRLARMLLHEGIVLLAAGLTIGGVAALAAGGLLVGLLYGVTPYDARTFMLVSATLAVTGLLATWLPARRLLRVQPLRLLRE